MQKPVANFSQTVQGSTYTVYQVGSTAYGIDQNGNIAASGSDVGAVINTLLDLMNSSGFAGAITIREGQYTYSTDIQILKSGVTLQGVNRQATKLIYTGSGSAIQIGDDSASIGYTTVRDMRIQATGAYAATKYGINATRTTRLNIERVALAAGAGLGFGSALRLNGGAAGHFSAYTTCIAVDISGEFDRGIQITGGGVQTNNANSFTDCLCIGTAGIFAGSIGIDLDKGDNNLFIGGDIENCATCVRVNDPFNTWIKPRFETNTNGFVFAGANAYNIYIFAVSNSSMTGTLYGAQTDPRIYITDTYTPRYQIPAQTAGWYKKTGTGQWHNAVPRNAIQTNVIAVDFVYVYPFIVERLITVTHLGMRTVGAVATARMRFGIYQDNGSTYPGAKLYDSGDKDASTATTVLDSGAISLVLPPGLYWLACFPGVAAPSMQGNNATDAAYYDILGASPSANQFGYKTALSYAAGATAMPDPYTAGGTLLNANADHAMVMYQIGTYYG